MLRIGVLTTLLALSLAARAELVSYADMAQIAATPEVVAYEARLRQAAAARDNDALLALATAIGREPVTPTAREHLLVAAINQFVHTGASAAVTDWLQSLAGRAVRIEVAHQHAGHTTPLPAYDPAAAARYALARRAERAAADGLRADLVGGKGTAQALRSVASKVERRAAADVYATAFKTLSPAVLTREVAAMRAQMVADPDLGRALIVAAERLQQPAILTDVVRHGRPRDARRALTLAPSIDPSFDTLALIRVAIARPATREAGLRSLAQTAERDPALNAALLNYLRGADTAHAAAAAIASRPRADLIRPLAQALADTEDADYAAALALCLNLMQEPAARRALRAWAESDGAHSALRHKIRRAYAGGAQ